MIWGSEFTRTMRSARVIVLLVLYVMFTAATLLGVKGCSGLIDNAMEQSVQRAKESGATDEQISEAKQQQRKQVVAGFINRDDEMADSLAALPVGLLVVFLAMLHFVPLYAALLGFDQISGEVGPRSIRFLTVRSRISSVLLGKYLAQVTVLAVLGFVLVLGLVGFWKATDAEFTAGTMVATLFRFWLAALVFSLTYQALIALCSSVFRQPAVSLVMSLIALFGIFILDLVGEHFTLATDRPLLGVTPEQHSLGYLRYASVWYYYLDLLHPRVAHVAWATAVHLGFAALFLGLAYAALRKEDL